MSNGRSVRYAEALRAAIEAAEPFRTMSTFNQERWDMTVLLLDAAPEIAAALEAAGRALALYDEDELAPGSALDVALRALDAKVPV